MTRAVVGRLVLRVERVPGALVSTRAWLLGGSRLEPTPGLALVAGRGLAEGTRRRDFERLAAEIEARGMALQTAAGAEAQAVSLDALAADAGLALDLLAEILLEATFPEDRLHWLARQAAAELDGFLDAPEARTYLAFLDQIYRPHPYGRPLHGEPGDLARVEPAACAAFHRRTLARGGVVAVVGEIDPDATLARLEALFAPLADAAEGEPEIEPPAPDDSAKTRREVRLEGAEQAHLYLGHRTVPRVHEDVPALEVASVILGAGAGLSGRLPERVREREGLAYSVDVSAVAGVGLDAGRFAAYVGTAPEQVEQAERAVREEVERFVDAGVTEEEVEEARAYLVGRDPFRRETLRQRAERMAEAEVYGLPAGADAAVERLANVDKATVDEAVRRWIRPHELRVTIGWPD